MKDFAYICIVYTHIELAIADTNVLTTLGLQYILADIMPSADISIYVSFEELQAADKGQFIHYFVSSQIYFGHTAYFRSRPHRTIVLVNGDMTISGVPTLNVNQGEQALVRSVLAMHQRPGHPASQMVPMRKSTEQILSPRESEIAILLSQGLINKEIASKLNISVTTVITHRKNIMEKLHARSIANIIVYVVMNGLADVSEL